MIALVKLVFQMINIGVLQLKDQKNILILVNFLVRPILIKSIAIIKKAAAVVHKKEKQILPKISNAIVKSFK